MTTHNFETIGAAQALAISGADSLVFTTGSGNSVSVAYGPEDLPQPPRITVTQNGHAVEFGEGLVDLTLHAKAIFPDGSRLFVGGSQNDKVSGSDAGDGLYGGAGADTLNGGGGDDFMQGNSGDDVLIGGLGSNTVYGGKGDDVIYASSDSETRGSFGHGNLGNDDVFGGGGDDTLLGGQGDDYLDGRAGDDYLSGDLGDDTLLGGLGDDLLAGRAGDDYLTGGDGDDDLFGGEGADTLLGGAGLDKIQTNGGRDRVLGGDGDDVIVIDGPGGAIVNGEAGNDLIVSAAAGKDILSGGEGKDRFEIVATDPPTEGQDDVILDWESGDQLSFFGVSIYSILPRSYSEFVADSYASAKAIANEHISATGAIYVAAQVGDDVIVFAETDANSADGADVALVLMGVTLADISLSNFV